VNRQETHNKLLELRARATRQHISYQPLFVEAVDIAADLLMELCKMDAAISTEDDAADHAAKVLVNRFEMESMALHKIQRAWLEREIAQLYRTNATPD